MSTNCEEVRDIYPELALGVAAEPERGRALAHVASCRECQAELARMAEVADAMVLLAPEREPPAGFESRVLTRLAVRHSRRHWRLRVATAAAAILIVGAAVATTHTVDLRQDHLINEYVAALRALDGSSLKAAPIIAPTGARIGEAFVYQGHPSWIFVSVESKGDSGPASIELDLVGHPPLHLVGLRIENGRGSWGESISLPHVALRLVRVNGPGVSGEAILPN